MELSLEGKEPPHLVVQGGVETAVGAVVEEAEQAVGRPSKVAQGGLDHLNAGGRANVEVSRAYNGAKELHDAGQQVLDDREDLERW